MNFPSILLVSVSLGTLFLGFQTWRLTNSRSMILNTFAASAGLMLSAFMCSTPGKVEIAWVIPFMVSMLFAGRGAGTLWRSRKQAELRLPSTLMFAVAGASLYATLMAYFAR
jgi:hypothetical protein